MTYVTDFILTVFIILAGFLIGNIYHHDYVVKNSACIDNACVYYYDKSKLIEYRKL